MTWLHFQMANLVVFYEQRKLPHITNFGLHQRYCLRWCSYRSLLLLLLSCASSLLFHLLLLFFVCSVSFGCFLFCFTVFCCVSLHEYEISRIVVMLIVIACKTQIKAMSLSLVVRTFKIIPLTEWVHACYIWVGWRECRDYLRRA